MTEDDAKTKWCPMVRMGDMNAPTGINAGNQAGTTCIGSACMMWRWSEFEVKGVMCGPNERPGTPDGDGWIFVSRELADDITRHQMDTFKRPNGGHCGLAGKP